MLSFIAKARWRVWSTRCRILISRAACGIGRTRWATHGKPSEANAHPAHFFAADISPSCTTVSSRNFAELREELEDRGTCSRARPIPRSSPILLEEAYQGDLVAALRDACCRIVGAYGLAAVRDMEPGVIAVTRKDSPIVIGQGEDGAIRHFRHDCHDRRHA